MSLVVALVAVTAIVLVGLAASASSAVATVLLVGLPYAAFVLLVGGLVLRAVSWARSPVPFHIPTVCGQERSLPWIRWSRLESPAGTLGVIGRMALEVLFFRSLFRNTATEIHGERVVYRSSKWLWLGAIAFHYSMLVILVRHLRLVTAPVPAFVTGVAAADGFFQVGLPVLYLSSVAFLAALLYLLGRRLLLPRVRYVSLPADYFPLLVLLAIGASGVWLRYFAKTDVESVKAFVVSLVQAAPVLPPRVHPLFGVHLVLVSALCTYFPFSKLVHAGGIFFSPTRNLANDSRAVRHINPWNPDVEVHTYREYEDEFRGRMKSAGIPVEEE